MQRDMRNEMVSDAMQCQVRERHDFALRCKLWRVNCRDFFLTELTYCTLTYLLTYLGYLLKVKVPSFVAKPG